MPRARRAARLGPRRARSRASRTSTTAPITVEEPGDSAFTPATPRRADHSGALRVRRHGEVYEAETCSARGGGAEDNRADSPRTRGARPVQARDPLARKVTHVNVCRIFDLGVHASPARRARRFLTMELLHGVSLGIGCVWAAVSACRGPAHRRAEVAAPILHRRASSPRLQERQRDVCAARGCVRAWSPIRAGPRRRG